MLDLLIILLPHLGPAPAKALFNAASTGNLIENSDAAIQKKSYRILTRLIELNKANALEGQGFDTFVQKLVDVSASIGPGAQRVSWHLTGFAWTPFSYLLRWLLAGPNVFVDDASPHFAQNEIASHSDPRH